MWATVSRERGPSEARKPSHDVPAIQKRRGHNGGGALSGQSSVVNAEVAVWAGLVRRDAHAIDLLTPVCNPLEDQLEIRMQFRPVLRAAAEIPAGTCRWRHQDSLW